MGERGPGHRRPAGADLRAGPDTADQYGRGGGRRLHRRRLLVHQLDVVRQPGGHDRRLAERLGPTPSYLLIIGFWFIGVVAIAQWTVLGGVEAAGKPLGAVETVSDDTWPARR